MSGGTSSNIPNMPNNASNISYTQFLLQLSNAANTLVSIPMTSPIHLVTHLDADGITAGAIIVKILSDMGRPFSISIVQQLSKEMIEEFADEEYEHYLFTDVGSAAITWIEDNL